MKKIQVGGHYKNSEIKGWALVDDEDYDYLKKMNWWFHNSGYAYRHIQISGKKKPLMMHRLINKTPTHLQTDHINGVRLDNRKCNLRSVTASQNQANRKVTTGSRSKYKGVYLEKKSKIHPWRAELWYQNKKYSLGGYKTQKEAALAYNKKALELFGQYAFLNKIEIK